MVILLVLVVTGFGMPMRLKATGTAMYSLEFDRVRDWSFFLAARARIKIERGTPPSLNNWARDLVKSHRAVYVVFSDPQGQILASAETTPGILKSVTLNDRKLSLQPLNTPRLMRVPDLGLTYVEIAVPIPANGGPPGELAAAPVKGYLRFALNVSDTTQKLHEIANQSIQTAVLVVLFVVPCSLLVTRFVVAPVKELARTAHAIANGSMDARAEVYSEDEIGELGESFNRMADRVTGSQMELLKLNAELEERVQQRTRELEELAARDPLTGLYNRRYFGEVMAREFAAAERYEDDLTCLMFDLDHFKLVNDRFGHRTGDKILTLLAGAIASELRGSDVAARFGGDEFILLLPQTSASAACSLADRIVHAFSRDVDEACLGVSPTLSIGVASLQTTQAASSEALVHESDVALYTAKESGRNRTIEAAMVAH